MKQWARIIWYVLTLRCDEAERVRCCHHEDGDACDRHQVVAERIHRVLCSSCRKAKRQLDAISAALGEPGLEDSAEAPRLSEDARQRILRAAERS